MTRALFIVDVQNDFTEHGALGVAGGDVVAQRISAFLAERARDYALVVASRDWHDGDNDNGGHFAHGTPDFVDTWPVHCVGGTFGAEYDEGFDTSAVTHHLKKGQGQPAYSLFEGIGDDGSTAARLLHEHGIRNIDVVGLATDYCVRASALDALAAGRAVRVLTDLIAGVHPDSSAAALREIAAAGVEVAASAAPPRRVCARCTRCPRRGHGRELHTDATEAGRIAERGQPDVAGRCRAVDGHAARLRGGATGALGGARARNDRGGETPDVVAWTHDLVDARFQTA